MIARLFTSILKQVRSGVERLGRAMRLPSAKVSLRPGEPIGLTELAENVGLAQPVTAQLADIAAKQRDLKDDVEEVKEVAYETLDGIKHVEAPSSQPTLGTQSQPSAPMLGIGTTRVVQIASQPRKAVLGYGAGRVAAGTTTQAIPASLWPVLKVLGLIAAVGFVVVKTFQWLSGAAEKAGLRLMGIFDQFADVSPAAAGMRGVLEVYRRRDRMAVAAALTPQWRKELEAYKELLDETRGIRIATQRISSQFRTIMIKITAYLAAIYNRLREMLKLPPVEEKEKAPDLHPVIEALLQMARNQNPPPHWRPLPPRDRRPGVR